VSYSPKGADAWIAEQRVEIERQHGEIGDLTNEVNRLKYIESAQHDYEQEIDELTSVVDAQAADLKDTERELDRLSEAITSAIADLRVLSEVPMGELEDAVKAIADRLADKNGEAY
jgi:uncharacterized coiled-coil protein SlyX